MTMVALLRRQDEHGPSVLPGVGRRGAGLCATFRTLMSRCRSRTTSPWPSWDGSFPLDDRRVLEAFAAQAAVVVRARAALP